MTLSLYVDPEIKADAGSVTEVVPDAIGADSYTFTPEESLKTADHV